VCVCVLPQLVAAETAISDLRKEVLSLRDETAVRDLEDRLARTEEELMKSEQLKDELAALLEEVKLPLRCRAWDGSFHPVVPCCCCFSSGTRKRGASSTICGSLRTNGSCG
jgi:uncharacterized protein YdcH (DUF465 family)